MKNIPNILTVLRLLACPLLIYLFSPAFRYKYENLLTDASPLRWILIIFVLACLTDFFDGYLARKESYKSNFGKFLDPIADKLLIITMCGLIIFHYSFEPFFDFLIGIPLYIIITREIIVSLLRFNLADNNKNINVSLLSKYKTFLQMIAIGSFILSIGVSAAVFPGGHNVYFRSLLPLLSIFLIWLSAFVTIITGVQHFKTYLKLKK